MGAELVGGSARRGHEGPKVKIALVPGPGHQKGDKRAHEREKEDRKRTRDVR